MFLNSFKWLFLLCIWLPLRAACQQNDSIPHYLQLYENAKQLQDSGKYRESLPLLKKALKEKPDYWEAHNMMANASLKLGKYKDVFKALDKAEQIAPLNYPSLKTRGITHFLNNQFSESKKALDTAAYFAMLDFIEDAELHYYRAQLMFKGRSYKEALAACEAALEINPRMWEVIILKAEVRQALKQHKHAVLDLDEAIKVMPPENTDYRAYKLRAQNKFELADYQGAVGDWNVYIDAIPGEEEALIARAAAKINVNDNSGAIADLDEAIKLNGKNPVSWCYRGVAKGGNKSFEAALKDLDQSLKLKFDYATAYVNRAAIKMAVRDKQGACKDLEKADSLGSETAYKLIDRYCK